MKKPDDASLDHRQYCKVRSQAERLLSDASAFGQFPTPIDDLMAAARVEEIPEDILNLRFVQKMRRKAGTALKRAVEKVLGLFDARDRLIFIDRSLHGVKQTFIRLHETGHGFMAWQRDAYAIVEECAQSLDPDIAELFDREANVFASEVLFQLDSFTNEAEEKPFGIRAPINMSRKYGASVYASVRRYVSHSPRRCIVLVLNKPEFVAGDGYSATLRRTIVSKSFREIFGKVDWPATYTPDDPIGALMPLGKQRMSGQRAIVLKDQNGDRHECITEAFTNTWQVFILIHATKTLTAKSVLIAAFG